MSDDILQMLVEKEAALETELQKVRAARQALGTGAKAKGIPRVQMTADDDDAPSGTTLPAPQRHMSAAARKKLSVRMKARWKALKAQK